MVYAPKDRRDEEEENFIQKYSKQVYMPSFVWLILIVELCERITYYSISANLLLFCQSELKLNATDASVIVLVFTGISYTFPLVGGWIADTWSGKFNSIFGSCLFYFIGTCLIPTIAYNSYDISLNKRYIFFGISLFMISIGSGGIKSTISSFGAEQVQPHGEKAIRKFFNWFYWLINLASFVSFTFIAYLQTKSFFYGYIPAVSAMFVSILVFLSGRSKYTCKPANGSRLSDIVLIISHAISRKFKYKRIVKAELPIGADLDLLDYAHISFGGKYSSEQIDIVRCVGRIMVVFLSMILFWTVYFQMPTTFLLQGQYMNLHLVNEFKVPATSLNIFDCIVILILIQLMEYCIYPLCIRCDFNLTPLRRMGIGMALAALSMVAAGLTEIYRKRHMNGSVVNEISSKSYNASSTTVFLQVPQYALVGCSEVFTSIAALEFAYSQSPRFLQGVVMGLFLVTSGIGAFLGSICITLFSKYSNGWFCDDINTCNLEYYFFTLAGLTLLNLFLFTIMAVKYSYVDNFLIASPGRKKSVESLFQHSRNEDENWDRKSPAVSEGHI